MCVSYTFFRRNILIDENGNAKLGDFGFSKAIPRMIGDRLLVTVALVSRSLGYNAPETDVAHVSPKSDVCAYGVIGDVFFFTLVHLYPTTGCFGNVYRQAGI